MTQHQEQSGVNGLLTLTVSGGGRGSDYGTDTPPPETVTNVLTLHFENALYNFVE